MISPVFDHLKSWIRETLGDVEVTPDPPAAMGGGRSVSLYLKTLSESPSSGTTLKMDRLQVQLTFLVTTNGKTILEADDDLATLVFSAMLLEGVTVSIDPLPAGEWRAFGIVPRPSFLLKTPLNFKVERPEVRRVEKPLVIKSSALSGKNSGRPDNNSDKSGKPDKSFKPDKT
jgi:hypothetical protein